MKKTEECFIVKITYNKPKYSSDPNTVYYMSGEDTWCESANLICARQFNSVKNAKSSINTRKRYGRLKDCKCEIIRANFTVEELDVIEPNA